MLFYIAITTDILITQYTPYIYIYIYIHIWVWAEKLMLKTFWPMGSKHCNINEKSVWTAKWTKFKNRTYLVTFYESQLMNFTQTLIHMCVFVRVGGT